MTSGLLFWENACLINREKIKKRADISQTNQETYSKNSLFFLDFVYLSTIKAIGQYNYTKNSLNNDKIKDEQTGIKGAFLLVFFIIHSISVLSL